MKQSCIMRQCIAVSAQKAQAGLLQGLPAGLSCPRGALWDEGGLGALVTLGQPGHAVRLLCIIWCSITLTFLEVPLVKKSGQPVLTVTLLLTFVVQSPGPLLTS